MSIPIAQGGRRCYSCHGWLGMGRERGDPGEREHQPSDKRINSRWGLAN